MPDYKDEVKEELVAFLTLLFKFLIGEGSEVSDWNSSKSSKENSSSDDSEEEKKDSNCRLPIIVCFDDAHRMCATSWTLLDSITYECEHIAFVLIVKSDERDRLMVVPESVQEFERAWDSMTSTKGFTVRVIDLPMLSP